jgi:hypothetical protein
MNRGALWANRAHVVIARWHFVAHFMAALHAKKGAGHGGNVVGFHAHILP